ncbi:unnamed protein product [Rhodiola kirilowii]
MSEAYDRMEWRFLEEIQKRMGFPDSWIAKVMRCANSVAYRIRVNDIISEPFFQERGIRQGDLLSPYLFVLCMDWLARRMEKAQVTEEIHGIKEFESISGQRINYEKSELFVSHNINQNLARAFGSILGVKNSIITSFWWNNAKEGRYIAWKNKITLQITKEDGGLGFKNFQLTNTALLIKQAWRIHSNPELLISKVFKSRYQFFRGTSGK